MIVRSDVDPGELGVNIRFRGSQVIHPRARAAQGELIKDIKEQVDEEVYEPCTACIMDIRFWFRNNRFDIDGPVKRTMDAVEKALKELGFNWNDRRVEILKVRKLAPGKPGIYISMRNFGGE